MHEKKTRTEKRKTIFPAGTAAPKAAHHTGGFFQAPRQAKMLTGEGYYEIHCFYR